jgi:hypothetical protein
VSPTGKLLDPPKAAANRSGGKARSHHALMLQGQWGTRRLAGDSEESDEPIGEARVCEIMEMEV